MRMVPSALSISAVAEASEEPASNGWCRHSPFGVYTATPPAARLQIAPDRSSRIAEELMPIDGTEHTGRMMPLA
jgi:hypothetical protein